MPQSALSKIRAEAKRIKKAHPHKYDKIKNPWARGYIKEAAKKYKGGKIKKKKKVSGVTKKKKAPRKRSKKRSTRGLKLVKNVKKTTTEQVMAGRKRAKRKKRRSGSIGTTYSRRRRRSVSGRGSNTGLIIGLGAAALGLLLLTNKSNPQTQYQYQNLPPVQQTQNYTRNQQSQSLVNYAMAAGLAFDAIARLIDRLNQSNDNEVDNIYDHVNTTGDVGNWV